MESIAAGSRADPVPPAVPWTFDAALEDAAGVLAFGVVTDDRDCPVPASPVRLAECSPHWGCTVDLCPSGSLSWCHAGSSSVARQMRREESVEASSRRLVVEWILAQREWGGGVTDNRFAFGRSGVLFDFSWPVWGNSAVAAPYLRQFRG